VLRDLITPRSRRRPDAFFIHIDIRRSQEAIRMAAPTVDPDKRDPVDVTPTSSYRPQDRVWVYRGGTWRPGVVEASSVRAAIVTYRHGTGRGTGVDTLTARDVVRRADPDPMLDRAVTR
jgi:hypothetical protein